MTNQETKQLQIGVDYLSVDTYANKDGRDCTAGGATSKYGTFTLFNAHVGLPSIVEHATTNGLDLERCLVMEKRTLTSDYVNCIPVLQHQAISSEWTMSGGNFVYTSDSRLKNFIKTDFGYPIPVHDRVEKSRR